MPDSIPGLYKAAIEQAVPVLVGRVWRREHLPDDQPLPYVTIFDGIADTPVLHGDGLGIGWTRLVQVDLWQEALAATDTLTLAVMNALDGLTMRGSNLGLLRSAVDSTAKIPDEEIGLDRVAMTCSVKRVRAGGVTTLLAAEQMELEPKAQLSPLRLVRDEQEYP